MSIFNNFLDKSRKLDLGSYSDNFSRKGYNWDEIKKQMLGSTDENPPEPIKPSPNESSISRENSWSFFNNPRSEWEEKRKRMTEDYKKEMQLKFQEKVERDKVPKFIERQSIYNSPPQVEKPDPVQSYPRYNQSQISYPTYESPAAPAKFDYYSPQVNRKISPEAPKPSNPPKSEPTYEYSRTNLTFDQSRSLREKQLEEWRKTVQAQVEERNKQKEEAKSRKMLEDKLEEAKIKREVDELNKKHQQEIRFEAGMPIEEKYEPRLVYEPPPQRPPPKIEEREAYPARPVIKRQTKPKEDYKVRHEIVLQEAGIRDIIHQIKAEASHAAAERQEIIQDLERMKFELRNSRLFDPFSHSYGYNRQVYQDPLKYATIGNAGKNIVAGWKQAEELQSKSVYFSKKQKNEYSEIENRQVVSQLDKLDQVILAQIEEKEEFFEEIPEQVREIEEDRGEKIFKTDLEGVDGEGKGKDEEVNDDEENVVRRDDEVEEDDIKVN